MSFSPLKHIGNMIMNGSSALITKIGNTYNVDKDKVKSFLGVGDDIYSTVETAVGEWIDGETLYRKTYFIESVEQGAILTDIDVSDINIYKLEGVIVETDSSVISINTTWSTADHFTVYANGTNGKIKYEATSEYAGGDLYLTLYYTKNE